MRQLVMSLKQNNGSSTFLAFPLRCRVAIGAWKRVKIDSRSRFGKMGLDLVFPEIEAILSTDPLQLFANVSNYEFDSILPEQL